MEYDGGGFWDNVWNGLTNGVGSVVGGVTNFFGGVWDGLTGLAGGIADFLGGAWGGLVGFFGFGNDDYFNQQRNGWGPGSFYNSLDQLSVGLSRYISSPMRYQ